MNKNQFMSSLLVLGCLSLVQGVHAGSTTYNPKPINDDLILPMPDGAQMVFRSIVVPGDGFWSDSERLIQIGDGEGGIFEGLQRVQVSGSFPDASGENWLFYLGKYEVTVGQYIALMGYESLQQVSGDQAQAATLKTLTGARLQKELAKPLVFVRWSDIQAFIRQYNLWLFDKDHDERRQAMPRIESVPGYLRLPTEIEWEYAARGGIEALRDGSFTDKLPFSESQLVKYAWFLDNAKHKVRPVGLRQSDRQGLHDMLGNAQEMTSDLFRPEIWQGKPGGRSARGGSVATSRTNMRASLREEVETYRWVEDDKQMYEWRSYNTGFRLAIGSNVVLNPENRRKLVDGYQQYRNNVRNALPIGESLQNQVSQAQVSLRDAGSELGKLTTENSDVQRQLAGIQQELDRAHQMLDWAQRTSARSATQDTLRRATDLARDVFKLESLKAQREKVTILAEKSTRYQDLQSTLETEIQNRQDYAEKLYEDYEADVSRLGEFAETYTLQGFQNLEQRDLTPRAKLALQLIVEHLEVYRKNRRIVAGQWMADFQDRFKSMSD